MMDQSSKTRTSSNFAPIVVVVGGLLTVAGVTMKWFEAGGVKFSGTEDWTGVSAVAMGVVAILGGLVALDMFVRDTSARRFGAMVATAAGILAIIVVGLGFTRANDAVGGSASLGLFASGIGALFAAVAGWLSMQAIGGGSS